MSQLRFRSTPIIIGNFESCFKQRDESTVNAAVSNLPRNMSLSTESLAKWAFAGFGEGVLTVAIESEAKRQRGNCRRGARAMGRRGAGIGRFLRRGDPIDQNTGRPKTDTKIPDPSRKSRPLIGVHIFYDMKPSGADQMGRHDLQHRRRRAINGQLIAKGSDEMRIQGCVFGICSGQNWTREHAGRRGKTK